MEETTLTIANGETESAALEIGSRDAVSVQAPDTLPETVTVHVSLDSGTTYQPHQSDGLDIAVAAGKGITMYPLKVHSIKLVAGSAVGGDREFKVRLDAV